MSEITHGYFGTLDTNAIEGSDVIWENDVSLSGQDVDVSLWADQGTELQPHQLDAFAALLERLPQLDAQMREALTQYLQNDREFIDYYINIVQDDEAEGLVVIEGLIENAYKAGLDEVQATDFVKAMRLTDVTLWTTVESDPVVIDYRIEPETSDQILALKCDEQGKVISIDWES